MNEQSSFKKKLNGFFTKPFKKIFGHNKKSNSVESSNLVTKKNKNKGFDAIEFINDLGGKDNIKNVTNTINSLRVEIINFDLFKVNINVITKKYKAHGSIKNQSTLIILIGDKAKSYANQINEELKNKG